MSHVTYKWVMSHRIFCHRYWGYVKTATPTCGCLRAKSWSSCITVFFWAFPIFFLWALPIHFRTVTTLYLFHNASMFVPHTHTHTHTHAAVQLHRVFVWLLLTAMIHPLWRENQWGMVHLREGVVAHIWTSHGTHMHESWCTYEWVVMHIWMSHGALMWRSHGTHMDEW